MNIRRQILILFIVLLPTIVFGQYFNKRFPVINGWGGAGFNIIENTTGYFTTGGFISSITGRQSIQVLLCDFNGSVLDKKLYGDTSFSYFPGVQGSWLKVSSGGYALFGGKAGGTVNSNQGILFRFDELGDTLWTKTYGDNFSFQTGKCVKETSDNGFVLLGINSSNDLDGDMWVIKTDSLGNVEWDTLIGGAFADTPSAIDVCSDRGFIIASETNNSGPNTPATKNIEIIKLDSIGNIEFSSIFGGIFNDAAWSISQTFDNGYIFGGALTDSDPCGGCEISYPYAIKLNSLGDTIWTRTYGSALNATTFRTVRELNNGEFIGVGQVWQTDGVTFGRFEGLLVKIAANGNSLFYGTHRKLNGPTSDHDIKDIRPTSDNGFVTVGQVFPKSPDTGTQDLWIMKLDSNGCVNTNCSVGIEDEIEAFNVKVAKVHPNPSNGSFIVELNDINDAVLEIYNISGQLVRQTTLQSNTEMIDINNQPNGIYLLKISNNNQVVIKRIIKQ